MHAELSPSPYLEELFQRADPSRQRHESVRELGDQRLAGVHRVDDAQVGERLMRHFALDQHLRNNADDVAQLVEHCFGYRRHQPNTGSTVNHADASLAKQSTESARACHIIGAYTGVRSAENRQASDLAHARGRIAAMMLTPRPASDWPPSQTTIAPVMNLAASVERNSARSAISSFVANRCSGMLRVNCFLISGVGARRRIPSVSSTAPGAMELTRTPSGPHSIARHLVSMSTPAFAAQTCDCSGVGVNACIAEMLMMDAPGRLRCSNTARHVLKVPSRSMSTTDLKPLADMPRAGAGKFPAAPQTTRSISPCASRADLIAPTSASYSRTSAGCPLAVPPAWRISSAAASSFSFVRPISATFAPLPANRLAIAKLIPLPPPVISAFFPESSFDPNTSAINPPGQHGHSRTANLPMV